MIMKRILALALVTLATAAGAASAMTTTELSESSKAEVRRFVPNADLSSLTVAQAGAIEAILYGGDNDARGAKIRAVLR